MGKDHSLHIFFSFFPETGSLSLSALCWPEISRVAKVNLEVFFLPQLLHAGTADMHLHAQLTAVFKGS